MLALRLVTGANLDHYLALKQDLRETVDEIKERYKRTLRRLRKRRTKPQEDMEAERRQLEQHRYDEFNRRVRRLVEDAPDRSAEGWSSWPVRAPSLQYVVAARGKLPAHFCSFGFVPAAPVEAVTSAK